MKDSENQKAEKTVHVPVLLNEVIENLNLKKGDIVIDGTLGGGGYAKEICKIIGEAGTLVGFDQDEDAIKRAEKRLDDCKDCLCKKNLINN
ncbi:16S rRNA (cytosine(1402)-N(4))-methyltransferase, partial [Patescibacteria group bacterium]|nr:16S rRNA (cytosine(1402)-N(4))-methyltransferase [Patescibacteria group bacterium]